MACQGVFRRYLTNRYKIHLHHIGGVAAESKTELFCLSLCVCGLIISESLKSLVTASPNSLVLDEDISSVN